jgi:hypothetical protein
MYAYVHSTSFAEMHEHAFQSLLSFVSAVSPAHRKLIVDRAAVIQRALSVYYKRIK